MASEIGGLDVVQESGLATMVGMDSDDFGEFKEKLGEAAEMVERVARKMYSDSRMMERDIRMKAREIGASGLVHLKLYNPEQKVYMGVPVRLE